MIDEHTIPNMDWGIRPVLFNIGSFQIPSYSFFILLGLVMGIIVYYLEAKKHKQLSENTFYIFLGALIGGAIGAKLLMMMIYWNQLTWDIILTGKSIVGGLIGGTIGVLITKKILRISDQRKGNIFAPAIAIGLAIGRVGCFLRGCCYGTQTSLPWAVNFGDGILRHPTQLYESLFMFGMFFFLLWNKKNKPAPGSQFKLLMIAYFIFRFFVEFIRVEPIAFLGLTWFQIISVLCLGYLIIKK